MIVRKTADGTIVFYEEVDGEEHEKLRVKMPKDITMAEIEQFIEYLKKEVEKNQHGPN